MREQNFFDDFETPMQLVHARVVHVAVTKIQAKLSWDINVQIKY